MGAAGNHGNTEAGALVFLLAELPRLDPAQASPGEPGPGLSGRQLAAYEAVCGGARSGSPSPARFWQIAPARRQAEELAETRRNAEAVLTYWQEREGGYP